MSTQAAVNKVEKKTARTGRQIAKTPFVETFVRIGYIAHGVVYILIGGLALQLALVNGGQVTDQTGAIQYLGAQPYGKWLLIVLAVGLAGYSLWGFLRALLDPLGRGTDFKGLIKRAGYLGSAVTYGALALVSLYYSVGFGTPSTGKPQDLSAQLLSKPYGPWLVGAFGLLWIGIAAGQFYMAWTAKFKQDLKRGELSSDEIQWAERLGRFGYGARGVIFGLIGWFLIQSAVYVDPKQAVGIDGALLKLVESPYGIWVLGIVALGLVAFGVFSVMCARWMRVVKPPHMGQDDRRDG